VGGLWVAGCGRLRDGRCVFCLCIYVCVYVLLYCAWAHLTSFSSPPLFTPPPLTTDAHGTPPQRPQVQGGRALHVPQPRGRALVQAGGALDEARAPGAHHRGAGHARRVQGALRRAGAAAGRGVLEPVQARVCQVAGGYDRLCCGLVAGLCACVCVGGGLLRLSVGCY